MELQQVINNICEELESPAINKQRKRYLENYLFELLEYQKHNPDVIECPTNFELYCDINPNAPECRIFDD
jgi:hypothetical protein